MESDLSFRIGLIGSSWRGRIARAAGLAGLALVAGTAAGASYFFLERGLPANAQTQKSGEALVAQAGKPARSNMAADRGGILLRHEPAAKYFDAAPLSLTVGHGPNPNFDTVNTVYRFGSNTLANGFGENDDLPVLSLEMESAWENARTRKLNAELHLTGRDIDGSLARPLTFSFEHGRMMETLDLALAGNVFSVSKPDGTLLYKLDSEKERIYLTGGKGWTIEHGKNDSWMLAQAGANNSGIVQVLKVDDKNRVVIGGARNEGVFVGGDLWLGGNHAILPGAGQKGVEIGSAQHRSALTVHGNRADVLVLEDSDSNRWSIRPTGAFQVRDLNNERTVLFLEKGAPEDMLVGRASGDVGIGTRSPESRLHVAGALSVDAVGNPRTPGLNKATIYLDRVSGRLMAKINKDGETKSFILAGE